MSQPHPQSSSQRNLLQQVMSLNMRNATAAEELYRRIEACAERLPQFPYLHRPGRVSGTREAIVHPNYVLVYRITEDAIEILNVFHARQQYP